MSDCLSGPYLQQRRNRALAVITFGMNTRSYCLPRRTYVELYDLCLLCFNSLLFSKALSYLAHESTFHCPLYGLP